MTDQMEVWPLASTEMDARVLLLFPCDPREGRVFTQVASTDLQLVDRYDDFLRITMAHARGAQRHLPGLISDEEVERIAGLISDHLHAERKRRMGDVLP